MNAGVGLKIDHLPRSGDIKDNRASGKKGPIVRVFKWKSRSWFHAPRTDQMWPQGVNRAPGAARCSFAFLQFCILQQKKTRKKELGLQCI